MWPDNRIKAEPDKVVVQGWPLGNKLLTFSSKLSEHFRSASPWMGEANEIEFLKQAYDDKWSHEDLGDCEPRFKCLRGLVGKMGIGVLAMIEKNNQELFTEIQAEQNRCHA